MYRLSRCHARLLDLISREQDYYQQRLDFYFLDSRLRCCLFDPSLAAPRQTNPWVTLYDVVVEWLSSAFPSLSWSFPWKMSIHICRYPCRPRCHPTSWMNQALFMPFGPHSIPSATIPTGSSSRRAPFPVPAWHRVTIVAIITQNRSLPLSLSVGTTPVIFVVFG